MVFNWISMKVMPSWWISFTLRDQLKSKKENYDDKLKKTYYLLKFSQYPSLRT